MMSSAGAATNRKMMQYRGQPYGGGEGPPYYQGPPPGPPPPYYAPEASRRGAGPPPGYGGPPPPHSYAGTGPPPSYMMQHGGPGSMPLPSRQGHPSEAWYGERSSPLNSPWHPPQGNSYPPSMGPPQTSSPYNKHPRYADQLQGAYRGPPPELGDRRNLSYPPPPDMRYLEARSYDTEEETKPPKDKRPPTPTLKDSLDEGSVEEKDTEESSEKEDAKKKDALSMLAKVSSAMAPPKSRKQQKKQPAFTSKQQTYKAPSKKSAPSRDTESPPPARSVPRLRPSPIMTPNTASTRKMVASAKSGMIDPKPITPTTGGGGNVAGGYQYRHQSGAPPRPYPPAYPPPHEESRYQGPPPRYSYPPSSPYYPGPNGRGDNWARGDGRYPPGYPGTPPTPGGPAVVERTSFDSTEGPPPTPHIGGPHERRFFSEPESYWYGREGGGPSSYPPPRWSGPPPAEFLPPQPPPPPPGAGYMSYYPPPGGDYPDPSGRYTPPNGRNGYGGYGYVQQPLETKTVLKKKFSWKHYPELERFLIENRDDYLEHSSRNYTVAQKQFNNHLTERLIEVADENGYAFDTDDFNFVAIRDRIRCYYKSFVQTMKKRGLPLPGSLGMSKKKPKVEDEQEGQGGETKDENAKEEKLVSEKREDAEETEQKTSSGGGK